MRSHRRRFTDDERASEAQARGRCASRGAPGAPRNRSPTREFPGEGLALKSSCESLQSTRRPSKAFRDRRRLRSLARPRALHQRAMGLGPRRDHHVGHRIGEAGVVRDRHDAGKHLECSLAVFDRLGFDHREHVARGGSIPLSSREVRSPPAPEHVTNHGNPAREHVRKEHPRRAARHRIRRRERLEEFLTSIRWPASSAQSGDR